MDFPPLNVLLEFSCGFVLLCSLNRFFNLLGLFLMLTFCFKVLRFGWNSKSVIRFLCASGGVPSIRFCLGNFASKPKTKPLITKPRHPIASSSFRKSPNDGTTTSSEGIKGDNEKDAGIEDEVFDAMTLRKMVKLERQKANAACADLEQERTAACSSAEEAMAMILRLQNEKSNAEIQATQFQRMAEQKLDYDQEVIELLQWTITQHEFQKCEVEDQMGVCREELKQFMRDDEIDEIETEVSRSFMYENDNHDHDHLGHNLNHGHDHHQDYDHNQDDHHEVSRNFMYHNNNHHDGHDYDHRQDGHDYNHNGYDHDKNLDQDQDGHDYDHDGYNHDKNHDHDHDQNHDLSHDHQDHDQDQDQDHDRVSSFWCSKHTQRNLESFLNLE